MCNCSRHLTFYALIRLHIIKCQNCAANVYLPIHANSHVKCIETQTELEKRSKSMWGNCGNITCISIRKLVYQFHAILFTRVSGSAVGQRSIYNWINQFTTIVGSLFSVQIWWIPSLTTGFLLIILRAKRITTKVNTFRSDSDSDRDRQRERAQMKQINNVREFDCEYHSI